MNQNAPRWEWRTFAKEIALEIDLAAYPRRRHVQSRELYLLAAGSDANAKIRDNTLAVKRLQRIDEDGLEQWKPVMQADFPLGAAVLAEVHRLLALPGEAAGTIDRNAFVARMESESLRIVGIDKVRDLHEIGGCIVEAAGITVAGDAYRSIAAEDVDPDKVLATVRALGLAERANTNYVKFLKALAAAA